MKRNSTQPCRLINLTVSANNLAYVVMFTALCFFGISTAQAFAGISNGTFEASVAGWSFGSGTSYGYNHNIYVAQGNYSAWIAPSRRSSFARIYQDIDASPDKGYVLSFWAGTHNPSFNQEVSIIFYSKNDQVLSTYTIEINHNVHPTDLLQFYTLNANAPANTDYVRVEGTTNGDYLKLDDMIMTETGAFPVEWLDFAVIETGEDAILTWATASEINTSHFDIQRSVDGITFESIGNTAAAGSSQEIREYEFTDAGINRLAVSKLYYRLRQVDLGGAFSYSNVIEFQPGITHTLNLKAYPNPVQGPLTLQLDWTGDAELVQISSPTGKVIYTRQLLTDMGSAQFKIETMDWPAGIYFVSLIGTRSAQTQKIIKR